MRSSSNASVTRRLCYFRASRTGFQIVVTLLLAVWVGPPTASAETHAIITSTPPTVVNNNTQSLAIDSNYHWLYSVNASNQVQVTFLVNNIWNTAALGSGMAVLSQTRLYVDSGTHVLFYVGTDFHVWFWVWNGSAWVNAKLNPTVVATNLVGVDSSIHWVWFCNNNALSPLYFNGSAWVASPSSIVGDYASTWGGVVDDVSHALYWNDSGAGSLRGLVWSGRAFVLSTLDSTAKADCRPAVHPGTGEVYSAAAPTDPSPNCIFRCFPSIGWVGQLVGSSDNVSDGGACIAVNPTNGKVIYNRYPGGPAEIVVLTPSGSGVNTTWPTRTIVPGASGNSVQYCALDTLRGWYFYAVGTSLHIIY